MMTLGCDISDSLSILLNALARRSDGWDLLSGQDTKGLGQQMRMRPYHRLPARCFHHICSMSKTIGNVNHRFISSVAWPKPPNGTNGYLKERRVKETVKRLDDEGKRRNGEWDGHIRVDKVDGLSFELVGRMEIGEDEDFGRVFRRQVGAQSFLAHHFESFQGVFVGGGQQIVGHAL